MFNFERDINKEVLKKTLRALAYPDIEPADLDEVFFEKVIFECIQSVSKSSFNFEWLGRYGFVSDDAIKEWISQARVLAIIPPLEPLSPDLVERLNETYRCAKNAIAGADMIDRVSGSMVLATLPAIFDFIKGLSDEEVVLIANRYNSTLYSYLGASDLKTFRDDLKTLSYVDFEMKYAGCYNGMLENVIGSILDAEHLRSVIELARLKNSPVNDLGLFGHRGGEGMGHFDNKSADKKGFIP